MKPYLLLFPLLFLGALSSPISIIGEENSPPPHSIQTESLSNNDSIDESSFEEEEEDFHDQNKDLLPIKYDSSLHDLHGIWPDHVPRESDSFEAKFFNMLFILGLLIAFMFLASWALKRMMRSKVTHLNTAGAIKVLETRYLSPRATLYLIEVQDQKILIAESPTTVNYLKTLPFQE